MADHFTLHEIVKAAQAALDKNEWDYLVGGADTETSLKRNRAGLDSLAFRPRVLEDVSETRVEREFLGHTLRMPVILPPIGSIQVFEAGGGLSVAQAAETYGTLMILSSVCAPDFETIATKSDAAMVYQLYLMGDWGWMDDIIARSIQAGYTAFCLTVDTAVYSRRERDIIKRYVPQSGSQAGSEAFVHQSRMNWDTVEHIKKHFDIPLILKGINCAEDAARAVDLGVDVIYVSNHGGRQLDHGRACIDALPEVVSAVEKRVPIVVDGGFMRGTDVVKGLCLGADVVATGRLLAMAMAAGGTEAVVRALQILELEIRTTLGLMGISEIDRLSPALVESAPLINRPHVLSAFPHLEEGY